MEDLEYHSSEHQVSRGERAELTEKCRQILKAAFGDAHAEEFPLDRCVLCNRKITKGDFALEHQMFVAKGTDKGVAKVEVKRVRTFPRLWCFDCSIENAKGHGVPRPTSKEIQPLSDHWEIMAAKLATQGQDASIDKSSAVCDTDKPEPVLPSTEIEVQAAVQAVQCRHPQFGVKRIAHELRESKHWQISEKRVKKYMWPVFVNGAMCTVGKVFEQSPAAVAGLKEGDVLVKLGSTDGAGYKDVASSIVPLVSEGQELAATVLRHGHGPKDLTLTPAKWEGKGLLGCLLLDLTK